ncbi:MAG: hypothetical protein WAW85_02890 [Gordonia sp. (in: high G+C Gram-positive bacteria)]|uniref:hypothetical protein n=1 Tax=Gordonia sp. (in: high G+C Gram-positive bacteria) TaxID=84139 RepID=UPI003BB56ECA
MNAIPAAWNRISVGVVGLLLVLVGLALLFSQIQVGPVSDWVGNIDSGKVDDAVDSDWWTWVLVGVVVVAALWGFRLLATLIRPQAAPRLLLDGSGPDGRLVIAPGVIASAVAAQLGEHRCFDEVSVKAIDDRGVKLLRIVVTADPNRSYEDLTAVLGDVIDQILAAIPDSGLHVQTLIHLERTK